MTDRPACKFVAGQRVASVMDGWTFPDTNEVLIREGQVYQIRAIELIHGYVYVNLMEHPRNLWIDHTAFRALDERGTETGMAVLVGLLKTREFVS